MHSDFPMIMTKSAVLITPRTRPLGSGILGKSRFVHACLREVNKAIVFVAQVIAVLVL